MMARMNHAKAHEVPASQIIHKATSSPSTKRSPNPASRSLKETATRSKDLRVPRSISRKWNGAISVNTRVLRQNQADQHLDGFLDILSLPKPFSREKASRLLFLALHIDESKANARLALLGDFVQKVLITDAALRAHNGSSPCMIY